MFFECQAVAIVVAMKPDEGLGTGGIVQPLRHQHVVDQGVVIFSLDAGLGRVSIFAHHLAQLVVESKLRDAINKLEGCRQLFVAAGCGFISLGIPFFHELEKVLKHAAGCPRGWNKLEQLPALTVVAEVLPEHGHLVGGELQHPVACGGWRFQLHVREALLELLYLVLNRFGLNPFFLKLKKIV